MQDGVENRVTAVTRSIIIKGKGGRYPRAFQHFSMQDKQLEQLAKRRKGNRLKKTNLGEKVSF